MNVLRANSQLDVLEGLRPCILEPTNRLCVSSSNVRAYYGGRKLIALLHTSIIATFLNYQTCCSASGVFKWMQSILKYLGYASDRVFHEFLSRKTYSMVGDFDGWPFVMLPAVTTCPKSTALQHKVPLVNRAQIR